jgi:hypothetical protein
MRKLITGTAASLVLALGLWFGLGGSAAAKQHPSHAKHGSTVTKVVHLGSVPSTTTSKSSDQADTESQSGEQTDTESESGGESSTDSETDGHEDPNGQDVNHQCPSDCGPGEQG